MAFKMNGKSPMMKALLGRQGGLPVESKNKTLASPVKLDAGSTLEKTEGKDGSQRVVNPDTKEVTNVRVQRLQDAGAPASVIAEAKAKFLTSEKAKGLGKASPAKGLFGKLLNPAQMLPGKLGDMAGKLPGSDL